MIETTEKGKEIIGKTLDLQRQVIVFKDQMNLEEIQAEIGLVRQILNDLETPLPIQPLTTGEVV